MNVVLKRCVSLLAGRSLLQGEPHPSNIKVIGWLQFFYWFSRCDHNLLMEFTVRGIATHNQSAQHVLIYVSVCVELGDGLLGSDTHENPDEDPTVVEAVGFHSEISELEKMELHKLEGIGLCDG
jgi:hypothetical protein